MHMIFCGMKPRSRENVLQALSQGNTPGIIHTKQGEAAHVRTFLPVTKAHCAHQSHAGQNKYVHTEDQEILTRGLGVWLTSV